jgi:hypothetical protein
VRNDGALDLDDLEDIAALEGVDRGALEGEELMMGEGS